MKFFRFNDLCTDHDAQERDSTQSSWRSYIWTLKLFYSLIRLMIDHSMNIMYQLLKFTIFFRTFLELFKVLNVCEHFRSSNLEVLKLRNEIRENLKRSPGLELFKVLNVCEHSGKSKRSPGWSWSRKFLRERMFRKVKVLISLLMDQRMFTEQLW